ncbi:uncharacterized protein LOC143529105 [Bidens hawaiensis]|uniref:uncharacterized protein LOC143529105 n=1 Tax=Bidens hawaiensis TaxID=980011 RepID=UPI00404A514A
MEVLGCKRGIIPFEYLGIKVGANMNRIRNWDPVVEVVKHRLASWKSKTISIGGRVTLIKSVLENLPIYYFSLYKAPLAVIEKLESIMRRFLWAGSTEEKKICWVAWDSVTRPKNEGGLGITNLRVTNEALLLKWACRFKKDGNCLWKKVMGIQLTFGATPGLGMSHLDSYFLTYSGWKKINGLQLQIGLCYVMVKSVWNGSGSEIQLLTKKLNCLNFFRLFMTTIGKEAKIVGYGGEILMACSVKMAKNFLSNRPVSGPIFKMKWRGWAPLKCNIMVWRAELNKLPTRVELVRRGIHKDDKLCPLCDSDPETAVHLFTGYRFTMEVCSRIESWCRLPPIFAFGVRDLMLADNYTNSKKDNQLIHGIVVSTLWCI